MIIRTCPKCNTDKLGNYCNVCGSKLITSNQCPKCKEIVGIGDEFCPNCGVGLDYTGVHKPIIRATLHQ